MKGKRLIAVVLAMTVAFGSVCWKPPKAKAVVIDATAAFGAAAATAAINGTTATTLFTGMSTSAATTAMTTLMGEYATATGAAASGTAFAASIGASAVVTTAGALVIGAAAGYALWQFIKWLREEKGLEAGGNSVVVFSDNMFLLQDGTKAYVYPDESSSVSGSKYSVGSGDIIFSTGIRWTFSGSNPGYFYGIKFDGGTSFGFYAQSFIDEGAIFFNAYYGLIKDIPDPTYRALTFVFYDSHNSIVGSQSVTQLASYFEETYGYVSSDISLDPNPEFQEIPQEIPEGQVLKINTGIESLSADDPQAAADTIMQTAIDGALDPVVTVEADPTIETDPDTGTETDPDTGIDSDTNTSILDWLKQIWESICNIPSAIAEAIASIFVPSPDFYPTAISNLKDVFSDRMGLLTYPISVLFDFLDRVVNLSDQQPILTWGNIYLPGYATPLVAAGQYNLNDAIGTSQGKSLHDIYLVIVDAIMILAFVDLCRHKYQKIIHN